MREHGIIRTETAEGGWLAGYLALKETISGVSDARKATNLFLRSIAGSDSTYIAGLRMQRGMKT